MTRYPPRMDPRTGEWENVACPCCGINPTRDDRTCNACLAALHLEEGDQP